MGKRLRIRDRLLLTVAFSGDLFFEFVQPMSVQLGKAKGALPPNYRMTNFTSAVSRMLRTGYIEKIVKNGQPYLRITGYGEKAMVRDFPIFKMSNQKWDKKWRIVYYDISEKERGIRIKLQIKLKELGFGMIQKSVYISPFDVADDIREFIINQGLEEKVFVGEMNRLLAGNEIFLAERIWPINKIEEKYWKLFWKIKEGETKLPEILSEFEEIIKEDPCLPKELLPSDWIGDKVYLEIKKLVNKL